MSFHNKLSRIPVDLRRENMFLTKIGAVVKFEYVHHQLKCNEIFQVCIPHKTFSEFIYDPKFMF